MISQWARKRWLLFRTIDCQHTSNGNQFYTVGPGGDIATDVDGAAISVRPDRLEAAFFRQILPSQPNQVDYPVKILESREDYNLIALKQLVSFTQYVFYDPAFPLGKIYFWPIPQPALYAVHVTLKMILAQFASLNDAVNLPPEYEGAIMYNLALRLRSKINKSVGPGDQLPRLAKDALAVLRGANTAIPNLQMPADVNHGGNYNIYSDQVR